MSADGSAADGSRSWDTSEPPIEARRELFLRLSEQIGAALKANDELEREVLGDFAVSQAPLTRTSNSG